jgi:hypothetical protein
VAAIAFILLALAQMVPATAARAQERVITVPPGFTVEVFADSLGPARFMDWIRRGRSWPPSPRAPGGSWPSPFGTATA